MKEIRIANVMAVWKWWYEPIFMLAFSQYFSLNVNHLSDSNYTWNCCNEAQFLNKKTILMCLTIKIFSWNFLQLPIQKYNCISTHSYNRKIWVDIPSYNIFLLDIFFEYFPRTKFGQCYSLWVSILIWNKSLIIPYSS